MVQRLGGGTGAVESLANGTWTLPCSAHRRSSERRDRPERPKGVAEGGSQRATFRAGRWALARMGCCLFRGYRLQAPKKSTLVPWGALGRLRRWSLVRASVAFSTSVGLRKCSIDELAHQLLLLAVRIECGERGGGKAMVRIVRSIHDESGRGRAVNVTN